MKSIAYMIIGMLVLGWLYYLLLPLIPLLHPPYIHSDADAPFFNLWLMIMLPLWMICAGGIGYLLYHRRKRG